MPQRTRAEPVLVFALAGAAAIGAQYVAGTATRDALFLSSFAPDALPAMVGGTAVVSIALVMAGARQLAGRAPEIYVPRAFAVSAVLLVLEWLLAAAAPRIAAPLVYLHISGLGPMLGSGFWLIASERFDPRSAKKRFGSIGAAGTIGGVVGGLIAARTAETLGAPAMLPLLAAISALCAWQAHSLGRYPGTPPRITARDPASGWQVLKDTPYLQTLALLVLFGTIATAIIDYVFKVQVAGYVGNGPALGRFFSLYYAGLSVATLLVQTLLTRTVLERGGLGAAMSVPSLAIVAGGAAWFAVPGLPTLATLRGAEAVFRGSLLRSAYEVFYTPIPSHHKRAVKTAIDVAVDRTGDIIGAGIVQMLLWSVLSGRLDVLIACGMISATIALAVASRLNRMYVAALEHSLLTRAVEVDLNEIDDMQTRTIVLRALHDSGERSNRSAAEAEPRIAHIVAELESDQTAESAIRALRALAVDRTDELFQVLHDPETPFVIRRRLARVFSVCRTPRAAEGLVTGLADLRFEVRYQCGRSLRAVVGGNRAIRLDEAAIQAAILKEVSSSRSVWENRQIIDATKGEDPTSLEAQVSRRANLALTHVFTLLALILPAEPVRIAYLALHTQDRHLRGTALEYLESVLPPDIRTPLWPFLDDDRPARPGPRPGEQALAQLLQSSESVLLTLAELRRGEQR